MLQTIRIAPDPNDRPAVKLHRGQTAFVYLGGNDLSPYLVFTDLDEAATYLNALQRVCGDLLTQIRQAALLAEVAATEHDPEAAAGIRASYADEAVQ